MNESAADRADQVLAWQIDDDGNVLDVLDPEDSCGGQTIDGPPCGGCGSCMILWARHCGVQLLYLTRTESERLCYARANSFDRQQQIQVSMISEWMRTAGEDTITWLLPEPSGYLFPNDGEHESDH